MPYTRKTKVKAVKNLAEAIIFQSLEDIWFPEHKKESMDFFKGSGFRICAEIAGLDARKQLRVINLLGGTRNGRNIRVH